MIDSDTRERLLANVHYTLLSGGHSPMECVRLVAEIDESGNHLPETVRLANLRARIERFFGAECAKEHFPE